MRNVLFRGKRIDNDEWVVGSWLPMDSTINVDMCRNGKCYVVDPNSVGQYIYMRDSDGEPIFEGDKVEVMYSTESGDIANDFITIDSIGDYNEIGFLDYAFKIKVIIGE